MTTKITGKTIFYIHIFHKVRDNSKHMLDSWTDMSPLFNDTNVLLFL